MKFALSIAGTDPTSGAGLQADLRVFEALGVHGLTVVAAMTAQSTQGVSSTCEVSREQVSAQLDTLLEDIRPEALKTGMLLSEGSVLAVARAVRDHRLSNLVVDPVAVSTSGAVLLMPGAIEAMKTELLPLARVITPNMGEAALMSGIAVDDMDGMEAAARALHRMGPETVIITGGHMRGDSAMELLYDGREFRTYEAPLVPGSFHGTGCAYSAAITACLALGDSPIEAAGRAKQFVARAIGRAFRTAQGGMGLLRFN